MTHRLDVLLPYYGDLTLMQEAVRSVLAQTRDGWHLTIVDDGMPGPAVREWCSRLPADRVTYLRNDVNRGANWTYRRAVGLARAEHLVVMGADDLMLPTYVEAVERLLDRHPSAAVVQPGVHVVDGAGRPVRPLVDRVKALSRPTVHGSALLTGEDLAAGLLRGNWTYFPSLCWRREVVQRVGFRPGLDVVQDLALLLDVVRGGGPLAVGEEPAFLYRRHAASDSAVRALSGGRFAEERAYLGEIAATLEAEGWHRAARAARHRATSRLHALACTPRALRAHDASTTGALVRHALGA